MPRIAVAQMPPVHLDREATLTSVVSTMDAAAKGGAEMVVVPEAYVPGYPTWISGSRAS